MDGLWAYCVNIQLICFFTSHISEVDKSLMRTGRPFAKYGFKELANEKVHSLSDKPGFKMKFILLI